MAEAAGKTDAEAEAEFRQAVNMTPGQIGKWLETDESKAVGQKADGASESTGHQSGKQIIAILHKKKGEHTADDLAQMRRVVSYVHRHLAQRPDGDVSKTHWRSSLMNWGHAPLH